MQTARSISACAGRILSVAAATLCLSASPALADPPHGKGKGKGRGANEEMHGGSQVSVAISVEQARRIARDVGASGYQPLPPGIRKNLARGKPLPPGIAKKMAPAGMVAHLPVYAGHEWRVLGSDLVLVAIATSVVVEVLVDVFR